MEDDKLVMDLQLFADDGVGEGSGGSEDDQGEAGQQNDQGGNDELSKVDKLEEKLESIEDEYEKELDKYRNKVGHLEKELKEQKKEKMSEEEQLEAEREELEEEKAKLEREKLETYRSKQIADTVSDLDYNSKLSELSDFIDVTADTEQKQIDKQVEKLKNLEQSIREQTIEELQEGGSIINSKGSSEDEKGSLGKKLAKGNDDSEAAQAQEEYF